MVNQNVQEEGDVEVQGVEAEEVAAVEEDLGVEVRFCPIFLIRDSFGS